MERLPKRNVSRKSFAIVATASALILIANVFLLLLLECGFRILAPFPAFTAQTYQADPKLIYAHTPNSIGWEVSAVGEYRPVKLVYNSDGFRGEPLSRDKPAGEIRIFTLGDSIVEGRQVSEGQTLSKRLEQLLQGDGVQAKVINAGVSAYTTTTMNLMLRNRVSGFRPDVVVAFIFANDYSDNFVYGNYSAYPELLSGIVPPDLIPRNLGLPKPSTVREWLMQNSAIYSTFASLKPKSLPAKPDPILSAPLDFLHTARAVNKPVLSEAEQHVVDFTHAGLQAMAQFCEQNKIAFLVAIIPWPPQVSPDEWKLGKWAWYGYGEREIEPSELYQKRLLDFTSNHGIVAIDLLQEFRNQVRRSPGDHLFLPYDGHLTVRGHDVVARALAPKMEEIVRGLKAR